MIDPQLIDEAVATSIDRRAASAQKITLGSVGLGAIAFLSGASPYVAALAVFGVLSSQFEYFRKTGEDKKTLEGLLNGTATLDDLNQEQIAILTQAAKIKITRPSLSPSSTQNHAHPNPPHPQPISPNPSHGHDSQGGLLSRQSLPHSSHSRGHQNAGVAPATEQPTPTGQLHYPPVSAPFTWVAVAPAGVDPVDVKEGLTGAYGEVIASVTDMDGAHSKPRHIALLAVTQCGKTTTIAAIAHALKERYPDMRFHALDAKNSNWPEFFDLVCFPGYGLSFDAMRAIDAVRVVYRELERRVTGQLKGTSLQPRLMLVLDEWNKTREDIAAKVDKPLLQELDAMVGGIVFQGLEFGVHLCMVLQEANCTKIGLTDSGRLNIHFLALARAGERSMVDALLDNGMILKSKARCEALRRDFERVWNDRNRPPQSPVIVDSRSYQAESLPSMTFNLINHNNHDNSRSSPVPTAISGGTAPVSRSGLGVPGANSGPRNHGGDRSTPAIETVGVSGQHHHTHGGVNADSRRHQKNGTANPTQQRAAVQLPPDPWGDDGDADDGESGQDRKGDLGVGAGGVDSPRTLGGMGAGASPRVALPPDIDILTRFRSGWGINGLAVEYKISNSGPEFEHLKALEKQYRKEASQC